MPASEEKGKEKMNIVMGVIQEDQRKVVEML